EWS
ncbi:Hypothetical protein NocV09_02500010, partial [Nannochloropsis oceanica]